jgi:predicted acyltransferase
MNDSPQSLPSGQEPSRPSANAKSRVLSIDALRGFDMFWIIGGDTFFTALLGASGWAAAGELQKQLEHVPWEGFVFYDLIFPLFLFIVGCAIPFSLEKYRSDPKLVVGRIVRRTLLLVLMGLVYNRIQDFDWSELRWMGVLQRIGICYGVAALLFVRLPTRALVASLVGILVGYWMILVWVPVPGGVAGDLSPAGNFAGYLDRTLLPGKIYEEYYGHGDNEGLLSTLPAIATVLLGIFAGQWLKSERGPWTKVAGLAVSGAFLLGLGILWGNTFPIIKNLWTSSFVLVAGGWSLLLLSLFYCLIDVLGFQKWAWVWIVIGANAITIYMLQEFVPFDSVSEFFFRGLASLNGSASAWILAGGALLLKWLLLVFLYRNRIFLRL